MQFFLYTDSHDQMVTALQGLNETNATLGMPGPRHFITDNPAGDRNFFNRLIPSLASQQKTYDSKTSSDPPKTSPLLDELYSSAEIESLSAVDRINYAINKLYDNIKYNTIALDCEWVVLRDSNNRITGSKQVALIQISYINKENKTKVILVCTAKFAKKEGHRILPHRLEALLVGTTNIVGVNVSGDIAKIGRDFNVSAINSVVQKDRPNVINLGLFARERDVVTDGGVGLAELARVLRDVKLVKGSDEDQFSDWEQLTLTDRQLRYAVLDVVLPLNLYLDMKDLPDLTKRLTVDEAKVGVKIDLVPATGTMSAACLATRSAIGIIVDASECKSPSGVTPELAKAGDGCVVVQFDRILSPGLKLPRYKHDGESATLSHFQDARAVVPVRMLRAYTESDKVRSTPIDEPCQRVTIPVSGTATEKSIEDSWSPWTEAKAAADAKAEVTGEGNMYKVTESEIDKFNLSTSDIDMIRAAIQQSEPTTDEVVYTVSTPKSSKSSTILPCEGLSLAPMPDEIKDYFSSILGDVFHAMDRTKVPVKHEAKKAFFVALRDAFLVWNEDKINELEMKMKKDGMTDDEIKSARYYSPYLYRDCVDRVVPPPSVLYWRVRAVYVLYGNMIDSKTKQPLFNATSWKKADNVLNKIRRGFYSDPPGIQWYTRRQNEDGSTTTNKYGMETYDCARGTNALESYHKDLTTTFASWGEGIETSACLLRMRRHRSNQRCSERKRFGYSRTGHFDGWLLENVKLLVLKNHGVLLYPGRISSSEFRSTSEGFDVLPLQQFDVHDALIKRCEEIDVPVLSSRDLRYLHESTGTPLPFLPVSANETKYFSKYAQTQSKFDPHKAAVYWNRNYVDGVNVMPKLECHMRDYLKQWERIQRIKQSFEQCSDGRGMLEKLNKILPTSKPRVESPQSELYLLHSLISMLVISFLSG